MIMIIMMRGGITTTGWTEVTVTVNTTTDTITVIRYLGRISHPWQRKEPIPNQRALEMVHWLVASPSPLSSHSYGVILARRNMEMDTPR